MSGTINDPTGAAIGLGAREYKWTSLADTETPDFATVQGGGADIGIQFIEESGTATVTMQGTNLITAGVPNNWVDLYDTDGTAISITGNDFAQLKVVPKFIQPVVTGTGVWTISMVQRG